MGFLVFKVLYFSLNIIFGKTTPPKLFSYHQTFVNGDENNKDKTTLFGYKVLLSSDRNSLLISSPGKKDAKGNQRGDVFKCAVSTPNAACESLFRNAVHPGLLKSDRFIKTLVGIDISRPGTEGVMVCQSNHGAIPTSFDNCYCCSETSAGACSETTCIFNTHLKGWEISYLNLMRTKQVSHQNINTLAWISRHFKVESSFAGVGLLTLDSNTVTNKIYFHATPKEEWIPTIGFEIDYLLGSEKLVLVVATNDDDDQKGKLYFYEFPISGKNPEPTLVLEDATWPALSNFGTKIISIDINNDGGNDLLVTSPTSALLDLTEVGHVDIFMNINKVPHFSKTSKIAVRGKPVARSYFGWNAESVNDIDGDGIKDFIVAALKVSDQDARGGIYIFLGDTNIDQEFTYYEIIQPQGTGTDFAGFGFFISMEWGVYQATAKDLIISRVFDGAVDVYKRTVNKPPKATMKVKDGAIQLDHQYFESVWKKTASNPKIEICFHNIKTAVDAKIHLRVLDSYDLHSFNSNFIMDSLVTTRRIQSDTAGCVLFPVYVQPWFKDLNLKWRVQAEVLLTEVDDGVGTAQTSILLQRNFHSEINFTQVCQSTKVCPSTDYVVTMENKPIWYRNTLEPIIFNLKLTNTRDLLTHLIINAEFSRSCEITISDTEVYRGFDLKENIFEFAATHARMVYPKSTPHGTSFNFSVQANCPEVLENTANPVLKISTQSYLSNTLYVFQFEAKAVVKPKFTIEAKIHPVEAVHVCRNSEVDVSVDFNVELRIRGPFFDAELLHLFTLHLDQSVGAELTNVHVGWVGHDLKLIDTLHESHDRIEQKIKIDKGQGVEKVPLQVNVKMKVKSDKDFYLNLKIQPVIPPKSKYSQASTWVYDSEYSTLIKVDLCRYEMAITIIAAFGCFILISIFSIAFHHIIIPRLAVNSEVIRYMVTDYVADQQY